MNANKSRKSSTQDLPALVLSIAPCGEANLFVHLLTAEFGVLHCLAFGGAGKKGRGLWVPGNVVKAFVKKGRATNAKQVKGELLYSCVYPLMHSPLLLLMLQSVCVLSDEASFPEDECAALFTTTLHFLSFLRHVTEQVWQTAVPDYVLWEVDFLRLSGFGLDTTQCAVTGKTDGLTYLSPRTGRAVTTQGAGKWRPYLFRLPPFFCDRKCPSSPQDWLDGLKITGHFLKRDVFSQKNAAIPRVRQRLLNCLMRKIRTL